MNIDRLRFDLADLAEEVTPVDLRDRAMKTSRRLGIQRAVATSAAAFVMLGAATGTAFAFLPRTGGDPAPAGTPTPTVNSPAPLPTEPAPTASTPAADPTVTQSTGGATWTVYYLVNRNGTRYVYSLHNGTLTRHLAIPGNYCAPNSAAVSPNGKQIAWVDGNDSGEGTLTVADLDGSHKRTLPQKVYCLGNFPAWSADSRHLKVILVGGEKALLDVETQRVTPQSAQEFERDVIQSPNGRYWAQRDGDQIVVRASNGTVLRRTWHGDETENGGFTVTGISDDGRYVAVGPQATDPSRIPAGWTVVDTVTGKNVPLPFEVTKGHADVFLLRDGAMLIRVHENGKPVLLRQVTASGETVTEEPTQLGQAFAVLGCRP